MEQRITIRGSIPIDDIGELNKWTEALLVVDEVYRLMKRPDILKDESKIDFRRKEYKEIDGAALNEFSVNSPPEIVITVDNLWIGALVFVLLNYKTVKENIREISTDTKKTLSAISGLTDTELQNIEIGVRLFCDNLLGMAEDDLKGLLRKIQTARLRISHETIREIKVDNNNL